jgi:hypothetical protein
MKRSCRRVAILACVVASATTLAVAGDSETLAPAVVESASVESISLSGAASAAEPQAPQFYFAALTTTTLAFRPHGASWQGHQQDYAPALGLGRVLSPRLAAELDLGPVFVRRDYVGFGVTPGVIWSLRPNLYLAGRAIVTLDPELSVAAFPGAGFLHSLGKTQSVFVEANVYVRAGASRDIGLSATVGFIHSF